ncbi:putative alpha-glycosyltransferase/ family 4 [Synechococcus sp. Minos11]|uniref:glycosyltransferase n=1 Tax=Synechococcus sp. Minos11 TaxID=221341 RepID=UPI0016469DE9|nr:glycosyltransferase [Synechococcus sp. Minos11]QNJ08130.1 putative alpha-glycosyltransferase/ family 4 [Synechococcus sp. Minos11]
MIFHVIPSITREDSGPSASVLGLCKSLGHSTYDIELLSLDIGTSSKHYNFSKKFPVTLGLNKLGHSIQLRNYLKSRAKNKAVQLIHNHGMWQMCAVYPGQISSNYGIPYVVSPRGAFSDWAFNHGSWLKPVFWKFLQQKSLAKVTCFHATAFHEYLDIRRLGFTQPVAIIPNGIDTSIDRQPSDKRLLNRKTLLFLSRIHPVKGLDVLLQAWSRLQNKFPDWTLKIVGSDVDYYGNSGYLTTIKKLSAQLNLNRLEFVGPLYGAEKFRAYSQSDIFVLPSYSENFGMSVAEALMSGLPCLVSNKTPWDWLNSQDAGLSCEPDVEAISSGLSKLMSKQTKELRAMGQRGREYLIKNYSVESVFRKTVMLYDYLLDPGNLNVPDFILFD